ncbi:gamma-glutamylcyclotransferase [Aliikangiella marina]|uniref:Gamma-glutamylcyclotransferase n=1 Tax=Aliikangiella marina TaxID=1712262 RepID=A0A545T8Y8_9GAMM|nr:gamma-glutamylcyclotransferase family protein [Aliikangiella marina]TQV73686.1 gamma-glutamylcyclotransferase [Aliikangiella marina]
MLYFAYGSNMSLQRIAARVDEPRIISSAVLYGYDLRFNKLGQDGSAKCSINYTGESESQTYGVVFDIKNQDKLNLDRFEGLGQGYRLETVNVTDGYGNQFKAITYEATRFTNNLRPFSWYHHHVLRGAQEADLPSDYLEKLYQVKTSLDNNRERHVKELAIYNKSRF